MGGRSYIIVHHTGAEERDAGQVRRYHLSLGWRDVGYNFIIEREGRVVEGRPLDVPGAHCRAGDMNRRSIGVALIGDLDCRPPTWMQAEALASLLRELMAKHRIPPARVLGHREVAGAATACPGRFLDPAALRRILDGPAAPEPAAVMVTVPRAGDTAPPEPDAGALWRVQAGAFRSREAAERQARKLRGLGIDALVVSPVTPGRGAEEIR
jgi:N-acetyl-anhydromuramyl-L-alanine amidase AmpD